MCDGEQHVLGGSDEHKELDTICMCVEGNGMETHPWSTRRRHVVNRMGIWSIWNGNLVNGMRM